MKLFTILFVLLISGILNCQEIRQINGDHVLHITKHGGKCRELRAVYYPTFEQIKKVAGGSGPVMTRLKQITTLEQNLPTRVQIADTLIRSQFQLPLPEMNIASMPTGTSYGAATWDSLYDAIPALKKLPVTASPFFDLLYNLKEAYFLDHLRQKKNGFYPWTMIYDCDTVLELGEPSATAGKRILFFQSDLDIDADGSDGERHPDPKSYSKDGAFQPETSYRWAEHPTVANPFHKKWETRRNHSEEKIKLLETQFGKWKALESTYGHQVEEDIAKAKSELAKQRVERRQAINRIHDMSRMRHLVGELDPFIVVPLSFTNNLPAKLKTNRFVPAVGDYAMVFYGKKIYPAIVGDQGPPMKCGEASLALARQIRSDNARLRSRKLSAEYSPFWDLEVSYLVFPGTAKDPSAWNKPDLAKWNQECLELIEGLGGLADGFEMHRW